MHYSQLRGLLRLDGLGWSRSCLAVVWLSPGQQGQLVHVSYQQASPGAFIWHQQGPKRHSRPRLEPGTPSFYHLLVAKVAGPGQGQEVGK